MDRLRIYQGRTLVGVEFAPAPSSLASLCKDAHVFERISAPEIQKITAQLAHAGPAGGFSAQMTRLRGGPNRRIAYWARKVPAGSKNTIFSGSRLMVLVT